MLQTLTVLTALFGVPSLFRAVFGLGRGAPSDGDLERRLELAVKGGSLVAIAVLVAAPLGVFGAWAVALALCGGLALLRPRWMLPGRDLDAKKGVAAYGILAGFMLLIWLTMRGWFNPAAGGVEALDLLTLGSLLAGRAWLWSWRQGAPFRKRGRRNARIDLESDPAALGADPRSAQQAWWDKVWSQRVAGADASFADAAASHAPQPEPRPDPEPEPQARSDRRAERDQGPAHAAPPDPAAADRDLVVPGYDPVLLAEELAAFRAHVRLIDRVALAWPSHPVSEALIHVSVILNETRRFLQEHPDKYRDLRPILVHHGATAADIARLVDRIKGTGETLDDAAGVANRLFALASLMRETRRKSTQAERDRLKASMAVIDDELSALSAVKDLRARMAEQDPG